MTFVVCKSKLIHFKAYDVFDAVEIALEKSCSEGKLVRIVIFRCYVLVDFGYACDH